MFLKSQIVIHGTDIFRKLTLGAPHSWISHEVTAAMLVSPNNEMAAMLVSRSNPPGIESYYYANVFFCFVEKHGC